MWLKAAVEGNNHNLKDIILQTDNGVHAVAIYCNIWDLITWLMQSRDARAISFVTVNAFLDDQNSLYVVARSVISIFSQTCWQFSAYTELHWPSWHIPSIPHFSYFMLTIANMGLHQCLVGASSTYYEQQLGSCDCSSIGQNSPYCVSTK